MKTSVRLLIALLLVAAAVPLIAWRSGNAAQGNNSQREEKDKFRRAAKPIRDRYIVVLKRETPGEEVEATTNELLARHGGNVDHIYKHAIKGFSIQIPEAAAIALSRNPKVEYVEEDGEISLEKTDVTPHWNLSRVDQRSQNDFMYYSPNVENGTGVHAYILDSGIRLAHRDWAKEDGTGNRATLDADMVWWDGQNGNDCNGHGTAVAGVVGGRTFGIAKGVRLHGVRVFSCGDTTMTSTIIAGVDWVTQNHVKPAVANMSLGGGIDNGLEDAVRGSIAAGVSYVVAAGNDGQDVSNVSPARIPEVLTVAASDTQDQRAIFNETHASNFGSGVDLFAPGMLIRSASNIDVDGNGIFDDQTELIAGTSFAAPHVAGAVARFLQWNPSATPAAVHGAVVNSATLNIVGDPQGSPNRLLYADLRHAKLSQQTSFVLESSVSVDSGVDVGPGQWLGFTGSGEIWSGVLFTGNNGPQGWNTIDNNPNLPLPGSRPFSLLGRLEGQNFYIGSSNSTGQSFASPQRLTLRTNDDIPGNGNGSFMCQVELWKKLPDAMADFVSQIVPTTLLPGQNVLVTVRMKNVSRTTWTAGQSFKLAAQGDSMTWGINRVTLPNDVAPDTEVSFTFNIVAPSPPGNYNFQWRMIQEGVQRFGDVSPNVAIQVLAPSNQAQFISQSVKGVMTAAEFSTVSITFKNIGTTTWTAGSAYRLGSQNPQDNTIWGMNRVVLPNSVPPGATVTFTFDVFAPAKSGTYNFQWRMVQDGVEWFGPLTPNVAVSVKPPPCARC